MFSKTLVSASFLLAFVAAAPAPAPSTSPAFENDVWAQHLSASALNSDDENTAAASGHIVVKNNCNFNIFESAVLGQGVGIIQNQVNIPPYSSHNVPFGPAGNGPAIKVGHTQAQVDNSPLQAEFTLSNNQIFYDLSSINGDPFVGVHRGLNPAPANCQHIECAAGDRGCAQGGAYQPGGTSNPVYACGAGAVYTVAICNPG